MVASRAWATDPLIPGRVGGLPPEVSVRRMTPWLAVEGGDGVDWFRLQAEAGVKRAVTVPGVTAVRVFHIDGGADAVLEMASRMSMQKGVRSAWPILTARRRVRGIPNDPLLGQQWNLDNTGQTGGLPGADARVFSAWDAGYAGRGVMVAVVDDGFEAGHPDLEGNLRWDWGWDYRDDDPDPGAEGGVGTGEDGLPLADAHGTAVAGIIGAVADNGSGVAGVAWGAGLVPIRAISRNTTDLQEALALGHRREAVAVSNNSWGPEDGLGLVVMPGVLAEAAREAGVREGRGGLGIVYVWAAGNGGEQDDDVNQDGYANSIHAVAVGALTDRGEKCGYSERGACLAVSAPAGRDAARSAGTWTTDLLGERGYNRTGLLGEVLDRDYTSKFNGTSAAAPVVAGVAALMLEANPGLGWRDVKEILMVSASLTDPGHPGWFTNRAGMRFNHDYGAGRVDAGAAVEMAKGWTNLTSLERMSRTWAPPKPLTIPDGDAAGVTIGFEMPGEFRVEQVRLRVDIAHPARGELQIELVSPSGTVSRLWSPHADPTAGLRHRFTSMACWGETAAGLWEVRVTDFDSGAAGEVVSMELELFGVGPRPRVELFGVERMGDGGVRLRMVSDRRAAGRVERSVDLRRWEELGRVEVGGEPVEFLDVNPPDAGAWYRWVGM